MSPYCDRDCARYAHLDDDPPYNGGSDSDVTNWKPIGWCEACGGPCRDESEQIKVEYLLIGGGSSVAYVSATPPHVGEDKYSDQGVEVAWDGHQWQEVAP